MKTVSWGLNMRKQKSLLQNRKNIIYLTQLGLYTAILLLFFFTPLGLLKIGLVSVTFYTIPVVIGAVMLGPAAGGMLGFVFGFLTFITAPTDPLFQFVFNRNIFLAAAIAIIPRVCAGLFAGLAAKAFARKDTLRLPSYFLSGLIGSLTNTVLFISAALLFTKYILAPVLSEWGAAGDIAYKGWNIFWLGIGTTNGIPEAVICTIVCGAVLIPLKQTERKLITRT